MKLSEAQKDCLTIAAMLGGWCNLRDKGLYGSAIEAAHRKELLDYMVSSSGKPYWRITPAGRAALAKENEDGR